ncbi:MAG: hypothetical protein JO023_04570, partial [Chloroflexi bacterium]|nr:hypothetical protein [Chloroflexota bacterium]
MIIRARQMQNRYSLWERNMAHLAGDHLDTGAHVTFNSGLFCAIETTNGEPFYDAQVRALASTFRVVGPPHARLMDQPLLALAFAQIADFFGRTWPYLLRTNGCMFPLPPLALPSGALGYVYLRAWPALLVELEHRGISATGPVLDATATAANPRSRHRNDAPLLRCRLMFDPTRVGPSDGQMWVERPGPGMLALGRPTSTGISMAGIDYAASEGSMVAAWSASLADPAMARSLGGQPAIWVAHRDAQALPRHFATTLATALDTATQDTRARDAAA